jgi:hypothetical protein
MKQTGTHLWTKRKGKQKAKVGIAVGRKRVQIHIEILPEVAERLYRQLRKKFGNR